MSIEIDGKIKMYLVCVWEARIFRFYDDDDGANNQHTRQLIQLYKQAVFAHESVRKNSGYLPFPDTFIDL